MTPVTIGIPACDSARTLARAIGSVRAQTCQYWRLVVSDDASTDTTAAIAEAAAKGDARISVVRQPVRRGAMNFGDLLARADTPYFAWLAADDFWAPEFLSRTLAALEARPDAVSALPRAAFVGPGCSGRIPDTATLDGSWPDRVRRFLAHPGGTRMYGLMRTPAAKAAFPLRDMNAYDWALMLGLLAQGPQVEVPEVLLFREETDWLRYAEAVDESRVRGPYRQFPIVEMSLLAIRRGHVPRSAWSDLLALNLRKHEEYVAVCHPAKFGRRLWLYRRLGLPFATRPETGAAVMRKVAARDPVRAPAAQAVLAKLVPEADPVRIAAPGTLGRAFPPLTAIVMARNAEGTLDRLLTHLHRHGAQAVVIDHASTDRTRAIAEARRDGPVREILAEPFNGVFDLTAQLRRKREVIAALPEGWVIHADADEFLDAPDGGRLCDLVSAWKDRQILAAPCREMVFLPNDEDSRHDPASFEATMTMAAPLVEHDPKQRLFRTGADLTLWMATGGHTITTDPARLARTALPLRHYIGLSLDDLRAQYLGRVFAHGDRMKRWHTSRLVGGVQITAPPTGTLARLGDPEAPPLTTLPIFAPLADDPPCAPPAGAVDLWIVSVVPGAGEEVTEIVKVNFPGLRIASGPRPPEGLAAVLHVLAHSAVAVAGATGADEMRQAACDWLRGIARARQAALLPGRSYVEVRIEDLPAAIPAVVLAVRDLLLGRAQGAARFLRPAAIRLSACPGPEVRTITTSMARDLGYDWAEPA
jgi:glycosyltransferase involved in cell wall biosynthesis